MDKRRSVKILKDILKKVEEMPPEEKAKISNELNIYVEKLHDFGNKMKGKVEK